MRPRSERFAIYLLLAAAYMTACHMHEHRPLRMRGPWGVPTSESRSQTAAAVEIHGHAFRDGSRVQRWLGRMPHTVDRLTHNQHGGRAARTGRRLPACRRGGNTRMRLSARRERSRARTHCAVPDRPLLQGRPPGVSTPVYEKIWSQFKGTHDQRCTERCDVPSRGLGRNRPQPNRGRKPTQSNTQRTAPRRLRARPIEHHPSALPCAHATKYKISHVVCADCRAELGADRPPSAAPHRPCSSVPHPCCVGILRCSEEG